VKSRPSRVLRAIYPRQQNNSDTKGTAISPPGGICHKRRPDSSSLAVAKKRRDADRSPPRTSPRRAKNCQLPNAGLERGLGPWGGGLARVAAAPSVRPPNDGAQPGQQRADDQLSALNPSR